MKLRDVVLNTVTIEAGADGLTASDVRRLVAASSDHDPSAWQVSQELQELAREGLVESHRANLSGLGDVVLWKVAEPGFDITIEPELNRTSLTLWELEEALHKLDLYLPDRSYAETATALMNAMEG